MDLQTDATTRTLVTDVKASGNSKLYWCVPARSKAPQSERGKFFLIEFRREDAGEFQEHPEKRPGGAQKGPQEGCKMVPKAAQESSNRAPT